MRESKKNQEEQKNMRESNFFLPMLTSTSPGSTLSAKMPRASAATFGRLTQKKNSVP
jgi:hypothetical protein